MARLFAEGRRTFGISLGGDQLRQLDAAAKSEEVSMSEIVRRELRHYFSLRSTVTLRKQMGEEG